MFGCWETLYVIKQAMEASGYQSATPDDKKKLIEATEAMTGWKEGNEHPQGDKTFIGAIHQCFGHQIISKVEGGKLERRPPHRDRGRRVRAGDGLHEDGAVEAPMPSAI